MAHRHLTVRAHWSSLPAAVRIAVIYVAARLVTTWFFLLGTAFAQHSPTARHRQPWDLVLAWDAQWYWLIAVSGYPSELPVDQSGTVGENAWAFMPVYPWVAQLVGRLFGSWGAGALIVSLVAGYLASLVLYRMLRPRIGEGTASWAIVFFACGPLAALFQIGYAEALFLLLLFLALDCMVRRNYGWLYLLIPVMAFTRPGILAFALFIGLFGIWRLTQRHTDPLSGAEVTHILALGALATATGFAWQVIVEVATGHPNAYLETELAWRRAWMPEEFSGFSPFHGFIAGAAWWAEIAGLPSWVGYLVLVILTSAVVLMLFLPAVRRLGMPIRLWVASYLLYLLAVFFPQSSTLRLLAPVSPLFGALAVPKSTVYRLSVLVLCLFGQWLWIWNVLVMGDTFWRIP